MSEWFHSPYLSLGSFDFICPPVFSHLPLSVSPVSLLSFILSESTSSSRSLFLRSWRSTNNTEKTPCLHATAWSKQQWLFNEIFMLTGYLNFNVFVRQFLLLLCLFSLASLLLPPLSLFLLPLPLLFKLSSSSLLSLLLSYSLSRKMGQLEIDVSHFKNTLEIASPSYLFLNFLIFDVLQQRCRPFG